MESERKNAKWWIFVAVIITAVISIGFGLLVGGVGGYLIGKKWGCAQARSYRILPLPRAPKPEPAPPAERVPEEKLEPLPSFPEQLFEHGAIVRWVEEGGPADQAGLRVGDIIIEVNGEPLTEEGLVDRIRAFEPGDRIKLTVWRAGKTRKVEVKLGKTRNEQGRTVAYLGIRYSRIAERVRPLD